MEQTKEYTKSNLCQLPELGLSCIGCCGGRLKNKNQVFEDIKKNTLELGEYSEVSDFINRAKPNELRESGICKNMTFIGFDKRTGNVLVGCPAHPEFSDATDDRENHCDIAHLCKITQEFEQWDDKKRAVFLKFLKQKSDQDMDWFEYSIKMDNDELLQDFQKYYEKLDKKRIRSILNKLVIRK
ncbi:MAG: hypothetical protein Q8O89_01600 [Nanoarchaeota archaeon]|nr:hypothetical protein [Nanoarchaeota archaeon]